ncbi:MAG: SpoIID/LytB domain-containing protein [Candidatus Babeliales bacterium]|nr:SpoIID/LytB domain-containing protein [Candidatus Babeliales bacterium]
MNIILLFSLVFYSFCTYSSESVEPIRALTIKVLLNDKSPSNTSISIIGKKDLITHLPKNENSQKKIGTTLTVNLDNDKLYINGKKFAGNALQVKPTEGYLSFENREYHGSFIILKEKNALLLINVLNLEEYVSVVLRTESWPGWPLEANKVLAICIRTYAVDKILEAKQKKLSYHIKTTTEHQTYKGVLNNKHTDTLLLAVKETAGLIITYNNKPILAMHDSCCAGIIPASVEHIDFKKAPYLARKEICNHCKISKFYTWQVTMPKDDLIQLLQQNIPKLKNISSIVVTKTDKAGIPQKIEIYDKKEKYVIDGKAFYFLNKRIRSYYYEIKKNANNIVLSGRGVGHHLGLCQWGARQMVDLGWDCKSIIQFYYPGTSFMKLKAK